MIKILFFKIVPSTIMVPKIYCSNKSKETIRSFYDLTCLQIVDVVATAAINLTTNSANMYLLFVPEIILATKRNTHPTSNMGSKSTCLHTNTIIIFSIIIGTKIINSTSRPWLVGYRHSMVRVDSAIPSRVASV